MADLSVTGDVDDLSDSKTALWGPYWVSTTKAALVFIDSNQDMFYSRTTDAGATWTETAIKQSVDILHIAAFFDKEVPGDTGDTLHIAYLDITNQDALYRTLNIESNVLGTERVVDTGITVSSSTNQNRVAITKTVSGNIIYALSTQTEIECYKSADLFATAGTDIADVFETATAEDWVLLFPAATADDDDACAIFFDRSADVFSVKMYDDSADTWTETVIDDNADIDDDASQINMDGAIRHSDSHLLFCYHTNDDDTTDDVRTADITVDSIASPTVTAKTAVVSNTAESAQCAIVINQQNDDVYIAYLDGGTWASEVDCVFHKSTDGMGAWGTEQAYSEATADDIRLVHGGRTVGDDGGFIQFSFYNDDLTEIFVNLVNDVAIAAAVVGGTNMQINIGDDFKVIPAIQINIGDNWRPVTKMLVNVGDDWKTIF